MNLKELKEKVDWAVKTAGTNLEDIKVCINTTPDGSLGCRPYTGVKGVRLGFDWERNQLRIEPEDVLYKNNKGV